MKNSQLITQEATREMDRIANSGIVRPLWWLVVGQWAPQMVSSRGQISKRVVRIVDAGNGGNVKPLCRQLALEGYISVLDGLSASWRMVL